MTYIDREALIKKIFPCDVVDKKCYTINAKATYEAIKNAPTEDVVPRSEYEKCVVNMNAYGLTAKRLAEENEQLKKDKQVLEAELSRYTENCKQMCEKAKQEVAREIFEEIESLVAKYIDISIQTKSITSELNFEDMQIDLAELKKKYIGE